MKKKILLLFLILGVLAFTAYRFLYKEHRDITSEDAAFTLTSATLQNDFSQNDSLANAKYADQTVSVKGVVTAVDIPSKTIILDGKLSAILLEKPEDDIRNGQTVEIKGRFVGYDDLLEELKMDQVTIIE